MQPRNSDGAAVCTENAPITISQILYCLYAAILFAAKGLGIYESKLLTCLLVLTGILWCGHMLLEKWSLRELISTAAILGVGLINYGVSHNYSLLVWCMVFTGMKGMTTRRMMRVGTVFFGAFFWLRTILAILGIGSQSILIHTKFGLGHVLRYSLGQSHPNQLSVSYIFWAGMLLYTLQLERRSRAFQVLSSVLVLLGGLWIFSLSLSTTGLIYLFLYLAFLWYQLLRPAPSKLEKCLLYALFPIYLLTAVLAPFVLKGRAFDLVNRLINTRLAQAKEFVDGYGISLIGQDMYGIGSFRSMDSSYIYALMVYGILPFILIAALILWWLWREIFGKRSEVATAETMGAEKGSAEMADVDAARPTTALAMALSALGAGITEPFLANLSFKNALVMPMGEAFYERMAAGKNMPGKQQAGSAAGSQDGTRSAMARMIPLLSGLDRPLGGRIGAILARFFGEVPTPGPAKQSAASPAQRPKTQKRLYLAIGILATILLMAGAFAGAYRQASFPEDIYILRKDCDEDDALSSIFPTEAEMEALRAEPDQHWIVSYREGEHMYCFPMERFIPVERVRRGANAAALVGMAALMAGITAGHISTKRRSHG